MLPISLTTTIGVCSLSYAIVDLAAAVIESATFVVVN